MNASTHPTPAPPSGLFPELLLIWFLPLAAVFIGCTLVFVAYTRGFSPLPEPIAQTAAHR
jgi:hypothetical protein